MTKFRTGGSDGEVKEVENIADARCGFHHQEGGAFCCAHCRVWLCWYCEGSDENGLCDVCYERMLENGKTDASITAEHPESDAVVVWPASDD